MDPALQIQLLAAAGTALGLAILIGHALASRVLAVLGTVLFAVVLVGTLVA